MLYSRLAAIAARLERDMIAVAKQGADDIARDAKTRAPDATPHGEGLVAAIHVEQTGHDEFAVIAGDKDVFWGHFQEFGTVNHGAQPFLLPAYEANKAEIVARGGRLLRNL